MLKILDFGGTPPISEILGVVGTHGHNLRRRGLLESSAPLRFPITANSTFRSRVYLKVHCAIEYNCLGHAKQKLEAVTFESLKYHQQSQQGSRCF